MQGETFEYVDITKKYRYISEQVVHHPVRPSRSRHQLFSLTLLPRQPISACIAQAPTWEYFGEVDAKSKFLGKSFEIRPTGIAHVNLRLPQEWAPNYPNSPRIPGLVVEHYSWTKVTTSVSNFLFGNPIIDHYGDMVRFSSGRGAKLLADALPQIVTNHRTGDTCTLTFKPRGWRGNGACEIKGKVVDASGKEHWDIAGKWNSQLVARRVGHGFGDLAPDASVPTTQAGEVAPEYIRLWKNSIKPPGMPFNLYVATLLGLFAGSISVPDLAFFTTALPSRSRSTTRTPNSRPGSLPPTAVFALISTRSRAASLRRPTTSRRTSRSTNGRLDERGRRENCRRTRRGGSRGRRTTIRASRTGSLRSLRMGVSSIGTRGSALGSSRRPGRNTFLGRVLTRFVRSFRSLLSSSDADVAPSTVADF